VSTSASPSAVRHLPHIYIASFFIDQSTHEFSSSTDGQTFRWRKSAGSGCSWSDLDIVFDEGAVGAAPDNATASDLFGLDWTGLDWTGFESSRTVHEPKPK
jgi:hypothetical protein